MKMYKFSTKFHWTPYSRVHLTVLQHWFRWWLGADQATSHYLNHWWIDYRRIYVIRPQWVSDYAYISTYHTTLGTLMTSAAADVINHSGRKDATILLGKYAYFGLDFCITIVFNPLWALQESANVLYITRYNRYSRLRDWADAIQADFQTAISRYLQNIITYLFCTNETMSRTKILGWSSHVFISKSTRFESTNFASAMIDDVGCSRRHQCPQCFIRYQSIWPTRYLEISRYFIC